ncbi:uncharacterized protein MELLADRAFT_69527 [Melampsora larici-populina 98AG31]|uniref:No apical meristem-associated C-terminal domain-containing protein n=1 Tax=Melampsora larici-populina (strain 98AG31 / pathotype 3-4-7) TaxID=747676 RepID=F4SB24_MELLP|nr:uncharacterized protein MELLADRAFT_69527 [Melampsora larici-populina 98AG31]EGF98156.1 hypothetical protein MELLADRAFT_69527 [Melampsora larici-populina 98AG31]
MPSNHRGNHGSSVPNQFLRGNQLGSLQSSSHHGQTQLYNSCHSSNRSSLIPSPPPTAGSQIVNNSQSHIGGNQFGSLRPSSQGQTQPYTSTHSSNGSSPMLTSPPPLAGSQNLIDCQAYMPPQASNHLNESQQSYSDSFNHSQSSQNFKDTQPLSQHSQASSNFNESQRTHSQNLHDSQSPMNTQPSSYSQNLNESQSTTQKTKKVRKPPASKSTSTTPSKPVSKEPKTRLGNYSAAEDLALCRAWAKGYHASGKSNQNIISDAHAIYLKLEGSEFARFQCYDLVSDSPKWSDHLTKQNDKKKSDKSDATPGNPTSSERPMGAKASKNLKMQPPSHSPEIVDLTKALVNSSKAMSKHIERQAEAIELMSQDSFLRGGLEDLDPDTQDLFGRRRAKVKRDMEASLAE